MKSFYIKEIQVIQILYIKYKTQTVKPIINVYGRWGKSVAYHVTVAMFAGEHLRRLLVSLTEPWGTGVFREPQGDDPLSDVGEVHAVVTGAPPASRARRSHRHLYPQQHQSLHTSQVREHKLCYFFQSWTRRKH